MELFRGIVMTVLLVPMAWAFYVLGRRARWGDELSLAILIILVFDGLANCHP